MNKVKPANDEYPEPGKWVRKWSVGSVVAYHYDPTDADDPISTATHAFVFLSTDVFGRVDSVTVEVARDKTEYKPDGDAFDPDEIVEIVRDELTGYDDR
jgi:hypothetical protein